jgi:hypothetical protein
MMLTALAASLAPCLLTGCDDDLTGEAETRASRVICFSTAAIDEATTRAASVADSVWSGTAYDPVTHDSLPIFGQILPWDAPESGVSTRGELITTLKSFSVSAIQTRNATSETTSETTTLFTDEENTTSDNSTWVYSSGNIYYWPGDAFTLDFYAVAPAGAVTSNGFSYANAKTRNEFTYTVPSTPADQQDLMVASVTKEGSYNAAVGLAFKHICTSIQFVVSNIPSDASITAVRLKGIKNSGTYSYTTNSWTLGSATDDFELSNSQGLTIEDDSYIASDKNCFIMLPQDFETDSEATVEVVLSEPDKDDKTKTNTKTYSAKLAGSSWPMGQKVRYSIDIDAEYTFQLTNLSTTVDAHYVIVETAIGSNNFLDGKSWSISVDNDASILYKEDANEFIQNGYWTDRYLDSNNKDKDSARGSNEITGTDTNKNGKSVYILIPENTGTASRNIVVTIKIDGKDYKTYKINQLAAIDGWEQIDEGGKAEFGFSWNRKANLIYPYDYEPGASIFGTYIETTKEKNYKAYCQSVIDDNEAGAYATVQNYSVGLTTNSILRRYYIAIDYSKLGTSLDCSDRNDGLSNTKTLKAEAGTTTSTSFEDILLSIMKTENNTSENFNPHAFRYPNDGDGNYRPADPSGDNITTSAAVGVCLKKNKYNLKENSNTIDGVTMSGYSPTLVELVWYMPAVDEFNSAPSGVEDAITRSECWSSTISTEDATVAYLGNGDTASRTSPHKIRAKRK